MAAATAGVVLVLILLIFVLVAGTRRGYSPVEDTISALGARGEPDRWWFAAVNFAGAALIPVFAYGVQRRLALGLATFAFLNATALGAIFVGALPCRGSCQVGARDAHGISATITAAMIASFMVSAALAQRRRLRGRFPLATVGLAAANLGFLIVLGVIGFEHWPRAGLFERLFWASAYLWVLIASLAIGLSTRRPGRPPHFDTGRLQRKILTSPSAWTHAVYIACTLHDADQARRWLAEMIDPDRGLVRPDDGEPAPGSVTLAFTYSGLAKLGAGCTAGADPALDLDAFAAGMAGRAPQLGDDGASAPEHWQEPWRSGRVDVLIWIEAGDQAVLDGLTERSARLPGAAGLEFLQPFQYAQAGAHGRGPGRGPLRFRDGISQPWLELGDGPRSTAPRPGSGALDPWGEWRPLAVGEFVLGEPDESGDVSPVPEPRQVFHHGSFLVVRKLAQDFTALADLDRRMLDHSARLGAVGPDFSERLMGRRRDGRPLLHSPSGPNDFTYAGDPEGLGCPFGAHIRRANPRDGLGFGTTMSARHRIIRRGRPYGGDDRAPPGWENGLVFVAVNARIADQFEFIQQLWLNDGSRQRSGAAPDLFAGSGRMPTGMVVQFDHGPVVTDPVPKTVRTMGGGYFFAPSMAGLRALAAGGSARSLE